MPPPVPLADIWAEIQVRLRRAAGDSAYGIWLEPLAPRELAGSVLTLEAPDSARGWVVERFAAVIRAAVAEVLGPEVAVDIVSASAAHGAARTERTPRTGTTLNPKYTFDQFVIGDSNRFAHAAALAVAEQPAQAYNPLFIYGPPGLGKTHLLHSIAAYVEEYGGGLTVRFTTVESFTNEFVDALQTGSMDRFKAAYRGCDVLLVDDVQFLESKKAKTEEELFHTFNELYDAGSQLVLASDRLARDIPHVEERLIERFEAGLVVDVQPPDFSVRLTILRKRAALDDVELADPTALEVIADRVTSNVRALEGALIRVVAFHSLTGRPIDAGLAGEVLDGLHGRPRPPQRSVRDIQEAVCEAFGVSRDELLSGSKTSRVAWPRQVGMYLSRELTDQTLPTIGRQFGGRNHATVLHACRRTADRIRDDRDAFDAVQRLLASLGRGGPDRGR